MSLQVLLTFPGKMSLEQFSEHLDTLKAMDCEMQFNSALVQVGMRAAKKSAEIEVITAKNRLTKAEEAILDQGLEAIHKRGISPLLDSMTAKGVGRLKPNLTQEIILYYKENPGHTVKLCAGMLAEKYVAHYGDDINTAFTRIVNLINTMCHAKGQQRALEKRDGRPGRGNAGKVYVLDGV